MTREKMWEEFETGIIDVIERWKKRLEQEPFDIETYCQEHFCIMVDKDVWEKAEKALKQEPKTGHWISHYDEDAKEGWYECDRCHTERAFNTDYCPDCGARMEVGE